MESFLEVYEKVKLLFREHLSSTAYDLWIKPVQALKMEDSLVTLSVKSDFQKDIIDSKYKDSFEKNFEEVIGFPVTINVLSEEMEEKKKKQALKEAAQKKEEKEQIAEKKEGEKSNSPYKEYTFENFVVGTSNTFAYAACRAIVNDQSEAYNPLFIYGPSGLGKTHLLLAVYSALKQKFPDYKIMYSNGEAFTNQLVASIEQKTTAKFREKYRDIDVLLMDDVQFMAGKTQTQEEFFHTFNQLYHAKKQIVLTSDRPPKDIKTLEERLRTRFEWGLIADIYPPNIETRIAVIKRKGEQMGVNIPDSIVEYLAKNLKDNIRQLEGAVKKFKAYHCLANSPATLAMAQSIVSEVLNDDQPVPITVEKIITEIANTFGISEQDIRSSKRSSQISTARQYAIYIVREITQLSYTDIGKEFNGRDHATILYALQKVEKIMNTDSRQKEIIEDIIKNIRS